MSTSDMGTTAVEVAQLAREEHTRLVELLMATIDVLGDVQDGTLDMARLRAATSRTMRRSAALHALAVAYLVDDEDFGAQLVRYADEVDVPDADVVPLFPERSR